MDDASTQPDLVKETIARIATAIDKASSVPVSVQLRGALEYGIGSGDLPAGARLPSVRKLAARLRLSPVTVSHVYASLQSAGHIEGRVGSGTFITQGGLFPAREMDRIRDLEQRIEALVCLGRKLGLSPAELAFRVSTAPSPPHGGMRVLMVGTFHDATEFYASAIRLHLAPEDEIVARTTQELTTQPVSNIDLIATPRTLRAEAQALFPDLPVIGLTMIPNEETRVALASIPPEANVVAISYFADFLTIMKTGIGRFAPHVAQVTAAVRDEPVVQQLLERADVLIHSTGAEYLRAALRPDQHAIEYRHTPDTQGIRTELLPAIDACRARIPAQKEESK